MVAVRVAVIGAGLGGLCLAQGLRRGGADVTVYERDPGLASRRQGYRLHLDARAGVALRDCLPPELFAAFLATCGRPSRGFTVLSSRLRVLRRIDADPRVDLLQPETLSTSVNRMTLREILLSGMDDRIVFSREFVRYVDDGATIRLAFADGSTAEADVLVGADGVNSVVRRQYLPQAEVVDTGARCVYGRTPLDPRTLALLPPALHDGFTAIIGAGVGMASGLVRLRTDPASLVDGPVRLSPVDDYLMWAVSAQQDRFPATLSDLSPAGLHEVARGMLRAWHPDLRELVGAADVDETFLVRIRSAVPVPAWPPSRVTVLGDAIHAMSPARGSGANTALRDAALLGRRLLDSGGPDSAVVAAIGRYEEEMREYGFAAVLASREAERSPGPRGVAGLIFGLLDRLARRPSASGLSGDRPDGL